MVRVKDHPLTRGNAGPRVFAYRIALYDAIGPGPRPCNWCGDEVNWTSGEGRGSRIGTLIVDHLDGNWKNNDLSNLVASCQPCNVLRGRILAWEERTGMDIARFKDAR
jgi:hypothetical protein